jgi:hypothetical protein
MSAFTVGKYRKIGLPTTNPNLNEKLAAYLASGFVATCRYVPNLQILSIPFGRELIHRAA